eukprot:227332-Pyramimonas_sp.AAC.1
MHFDTGGSLGGPLGSLPKRPGSPLGHPGAILDGLDRPDGDSWPSRNILPTILGPPAPRGSASAEMGPSSAVFRR